MRMTRRTFLGTAGAAAMAPAIDLAAQRGGGNNAGPPSPVSIGPIEKDVVYGKGGAMDLKLDIYHPRPGTEKRMDHVFDRDPKFAIACANLADLFIEKNVKT